MGPGVNSLSVANIAQSEVVQKFWPDTDTSSMSNACAPVDIEMHQGLKPGDAYRHHMMRLTVNVKRAKLAVAIASS